MLNELLGICVIFGMVSSGFSALISPLAGVVSFSLLLSYYVYCLVRKD